jgi:di/tripeptidase
MLRSAMRNTGPNSAVRPIRSNTDGLKSAGGSGRMASAGGSFTACHTTEETPAAEAPTHTSSASPNAL